MNFRISQPWQIWKTTKMLTIAPPLLEWFLHLSFLHQSLSVNKCEFRVAAEFVNCAAADWGLPLFANSTAAGTRRQLTPERQRLPRQQPNSEGNAESSPCSRMIKPKDFYAAKMFFEFFKSCGSCESCIGPPAAPFFKRLDLIEDLGSCIMGTWSGP